MKEELDVTGNIKIIEWIKVELLEAVTSVYRVLMKGAKTSTDIILNSLADVIILTYILSRRLGIEFSSVDLKIQDKLKAGIQEEDEIEKSHEDLSKLLSYIKDRK